MITAVFLLYMVLINLAAFAAFGVDKNRAVKGRWRLKERTLLLLCAAGGAFGGLLGMRFFRHKTRHPRFFAGVPFLCAVWTLILFLFFFYI